MTKAPEKPNGGSGLRLNGSKPGEIRRALRRSVQEARQAGREPEPLLVALADRMAGVADSAWRADDHRSFMVAASKLDTLARRLQLAPVAPAAVGGGDDGDDHGDGLDDELARLLSAGPSMGDTANT